MANLLSAMCTASAGDADGVLDEHGPALWQTPNTDPAVEVAAQSPAYAAGGVTRCTVSGTGANPGVVIRAPAPLWLANGATTRTSAPAAHSALRSS